MSLSRLKTILAFLLFAPTAAFAWMGLGGSPDYSRDAQSIFYCTDAAGTAVTTQAGLSITNPALSLYNPVSSTKNLVLLDVGIDITAAPAAAVGFMLAYNVTPSSGVASGTNAGETTALIGKSSTTAQGLCYRTGILPVLPKAFRYLGGTTGASAISGVTLTDQTNGKVVIPPGGLVSIQSTSAASIIAHFAWREDPL